MTTKYTDHTLQEHLIKEHRRSPFAVYLREIVYGGTDGIITTFAVVAGFAGAQANPSTSPLPFLTVLLFGFANLLADATSMGIGNFLSVRADKDLYQREKEKERHEIRSEPAMEKSETVHILLSKGFSRSDSEKITDLYSKNEQYWVEFMMRDELQMPSPEADNPLLTGVATFISFISFGIIPLLPYVLLQSSVLLFSYSIVATAGALLLLSIMRWQITRQTAIRAVFETVLLGGVSAAIAYLVGTLFRI